MPVCVVSWLVFGLFKVHVSSPFTLSFSSTSILKPYAGQRELPAVFFSSVSQLGVRKSEGELGRGGVYRKRGMHEGEEALWGQTVNCLTYLAKSCLAKS